MADYAKVHVWVSGNVQGVGFRYFVQDIALKYDLKGWVKNLPDGRVEFIAEGIKGLLNDFLKHVKRGPMVGFVSDMKIDWQEFTGDFSDFRIKF